MSGGHLRWEGDATALSSVAHGEQALGTVTYLRRERFLMPDGSVDDIPVVSGNAWRGLLRRTAGDLWWDAAGQPPLTLAVAHAIWSGGALAKSSGTPLTGPRLMRVRAACPPQSRRDRRAQVATDARIVQLHALRAMSQLG